MMRKEFWDLFLTGGFLSWSKALEEAKTPLETFLVLFVPFLLLIIIFGIGIGAYLLFN
jgi:hypothetical protein